MENFDLRKYLAENKLLKEGIEGIPQYYVEYTTLDGETAKSGLMSKREAIYKERDLVNSGIKKSSVYKIQKNIDLNGNPYEINYKLDKEIEYRTDEDGKPINEDLFNLRKYLAENKLLKEEITLDFYDEDAVTLIDDSGEYDGDIEEDGMVSFSLVDDEEEFEDYNWEDILGSDHAFVKINKQIPTKVEAIADYVMVTVNIDDLKGIAKTTTPYIKDKNKKEGVYYVTDKYGKTVKKYI